MKRGLARLRHRTFPRIQRRYGRAMTAALTSLQIEQMTSCHSFGELRQFSTSVLAPCLPIDRDASTRQHATTRWGRHFSSRGTVLASNHVTSSDTFSNEKDPYDRYRQRKHKSFDNSNARLSPHILAELQLETLHTQRRIDPALLEQSQELVSQAWMQQQQQQRRPTERGPTGTWVYGFSEDAEASDRRAYQRYWNYDQRNPQTVLELDPTDQVLSVSLTVDESCVACLVEDVSTGRRQVRLRNIESDRQSTLDIVGDGTLYTSLEGLEWGPMLSEGGDVHSLYFVGTNDQGRPDRILVSTVHSTVLHVDETELVIQSQDPAEILDVQRTKGCQYVSIHAMTKTSNEIYLSQGPSSLELVLPRQDHVKYHLDVGEQDDIVMLLSVRGGDFRLLESSVRSLPIEPQSRDMPDQSFGNGYVITDMDLFRDYLVLYEISTKTGIPQITLRNREASHSVTIPLSLGDNSFCLQVAPAGNVWFGAHFLNILLETPVTPPATYELDFSSGELQKVSDDFDLQKIDYQKERVIVSSQDGTKVPLSMLYHRHHVEQNTSLWSWLGMFQNISETNKEPKRVILIGYGSYGESVNMSYDPALVPLLEQGCVLAFAHTRGGGELGQTWYQAGRHYEKPKIIKDFIACAEYLKDRWSGELSARGFSAAGVMMGAAVNQRPDLFDRLILTNAFLDVHATMSNSDLYLTQHEWDEFGNPIEDPKADQVIKSYCPVLNVAHNTDEYPFCLLVGTLDDENVPFWNPTIFAKKVRDHMAATAKDKIYLHIEEKGGHHLGQRRLQIAAMEVAFILRDNCSEEKKA